MLEVLSRKSVEGRFGTRRGFIRHCQYSLLHKLGRYQPYMDIDWRSIDRLVFVCKGNICRSAFAEAVARKEGLRTVSCGIDTIEHVPANDNAIKVALELGYDLKGHETTPIQQLVFSKTDLLIAMEPLQVEFLEKYLGRQYTCTLLGLWSEPIRPYVHDPYGRGEEYFRNCFNIIEKSARRIASNVREKCGDR